jgi:Na+/H+ antiporter NhaD/arsenite permease-like protein
VHEAVAYIDGLDYTEPKFVFVVLVVAAAKPVVRLAEASILLIARLLPLRETMAFYLAALSFGSLLGSFITEPAAMTLLAILLKRRYFDRGIGTRFAYATLGLLFVNVSIGGTLTHFAAPPVLMVAAKWHWDTLFMLTHFGWKAAASCLVSTCLVAWTFRKELSRIEPVTPTTDAIPRWLTLLHLLFLVAVITFAHHPNVFFGVAMLFLGLVSATSAHQDRLRLREGLLVGFFLAGLVTLGSLQSWWLSPLISSLGVGTLFFSATALTALTDNAALTYLGSLVDGISASLQYALVAGAVAGGGLTVIANAPNPAGAGILQSARVFAGEGISPLGLFLGALPPTFVAMAFLWLL